MLLIDESPAPRLHRIVRRGVPALVIAVGVNLVILLALAAMNRFAPPPQQDAVKVQLVSIAPRIKPPEPLPPPEPEDPQPPKVVEVQLAIPNDAPPPPTPLQIDLPLTVPTVSAVQIAVTPQVDAPSPAPAATPTPSERREPKRAVQPAPSNEPRQVARLPREISAAAPAYPRSYLRRGVEGTVDMMLLIDERGHVESVEFLSGEPAFQRAVEDVVYSWRFEPSTIAGQPVKVRGRKTITFELQGR